MASLSHINGRGMIQFPIGGRVRTIRVGKCARKVAEVARGHVDELLSAKASGGSIRPATAAWLAEIGDKFHSKLALHGLTEPRQTMAAVMLAAFLDSYIKRRTDLKERTVTNLKQCRRVLVEHFGERRDLRTINRSQMRDWHRGLLLDLSAATVATHVKKARQFFSEAIDQGVITESPMKGIKAGSMKNDARKQYVPMGDVEKVIEACPDSDWRMYFALARFGGLRIPSECNRLRWSDVNWETSRVLVHSPKTEHHEGRATRVIPLYPDLLPHLRAAFEQAEPGATYVIAKRVRATPRTMGGKIVERSGVKPWPRIFQNLRASCQTDLESYFPSHVVCAWMGNTEDVAKKHYLMLTDKHYEMATASAAKSAADTAGQQRTTTEHQKQNPRKTEGFAALTYPQGESHLSRFPVQNHAKRPGALRKALQPRRTYRFRGVLLTRRARPVFSLTFAPPASRVSAEGGK